MTENLLPTYSQPFKSCPKIVASRREQRQTPTPMRNVRNVKKNHGIFTEVGKVKRSYINEAKSSEQQAFRGDFACCHCLEREKQYVY